MTVLVAVESAEGVVLGCDSFLGTEDLRDLHTGPKWRRVGPLTIAHAGSVRHAQALARLRVDSRPRRREDVRDWIARAVVVPLVESGEWSRDKGADATLVIAYAGRAYEIAGDLAVHRSARGYTAAGAGHPYAYGSLHATQGRPAEERVRAALAAACDLSPLCSMPIFVETFA